MGTLYRRRKLNPATGVREPTGPWLMKLYAHGRRVSLGTGTHNKAEALALLRDTEGRLASGARLGSNILRTRFDDLVPLLKRDYELKERRSWVTCQYHIGKLKKAFGRMYVAGITTERLEQYVLTRKSAGAANATINRELSCLHRMLALGQRRTPPIVGTIPYFPRLQEDNVREGFIEHHEFQALMRVCAPHLRVPVTILYYTGMRVGEVITQRGLRWDQVDLVEGTIRLRTLQTKTKTPRVIYLVDEFLLLLMQAKEDRDRHFPDCSYVCHYKGRPIGSIKTAWHGACRRAGLLEQKDSKTLVHDLRRTGARNLIRAGVSETVAMLITGHKTRSVFARYNITAEDDLRQAATSLSQHLGKKSGGVISENRAVGGQSYAVDRAKSGAKSGANNVFSSETKL